MKQSQNQSKKPALWFEDEPTSVQQRARRVRRTYSPFRRFCKKYIFYFLSVVLIAAIIAGGIVYVDQTEKKVFRINQTNDEMRNDITTLTQQVEDLNQEILEQEKDQKELEQKLDPAASKKDSKETSAESLTGPAEVSFIGTMGVSGDQAILAHLIQRTDEEGLSSSLVASLIARESHWDPNAVGLDGHDHGLGQVRDIHEKELAQIGITDLNDPYQNIDAICHILKTYRDTYHPKTTEELLMMYNMGPGKARTCISQGITTSSYADEIVSGISHWQSL